MDGMVMWFGMALIGFTGAAIAGPDGVRSGGTGAGLPPQPLSSATAVSVTVRAPQDRAIAVRLVPCIRSGRRVVVVTRVRQRRGCSLRGSGRGGSGCRNRRSGDYWCRGCLYDGGGVGAGHNDDLRSAVGAQTQLVP